MNGFNLLQVLVAVTAGGARSLPADGLLVPRSPYPDFLISELWINTMRGEVVVTGCTTLETADGGVIPAVWLETTLSFEGDSLSQDTLASSTDTTIVLAASRSEELQCLSRVTQGRMGSSYSLTISWVDLSAPGLLEGRSEVTSEPVDWRVYSHTCRKTVFGTCGEPTVLFWRPSDGWSIMSPDLQAADDPLEDMPGFHSGSSLAFMQVPLDEMYPIPHFKGEFPGGGLDPHHLATGHMLPSAGPGSPAVICLDSLGTPVWKLVLEEPAGGSAEYMGSVYWGGEFGWLVAGTVTEGPDPSDHSIFLAVVDESGSIVDLTETTTGYSLESIASVYDLILLSVIRDVQDGISFEPVRELYMFDIADPPPSFMTR